MFTKHVEGAVPLDNDQEVSALVASMLPDSCMERSARFIALLGTNGKLSRLIRTDTEDEFARMTLGLDEVGFAKCDSTAVHGFLFDGVYRPRL
ncbi:MAG: hypothetical protein V4792_03035 [Pseudomonadota bacterium]